MPYKNWMRIALAAAIFTTASAVVLVPAGTAYAQTTSGDLVGTIKDASGAVVANASIQIRNEETGVATPTVSNSAGQYRVSNLLPGRYDITATATGFQNKAVKGVVVDLNKTSTADVALGIGSATTTVEVESNAGIVLDTTSQNLTSTFSNVELSTLPNTSIGEGVINTSLLSPGVASTGGIGVGVGPSIAGQRPRANNFMVEGVDNNNKSVTGPLVYVPNDAVGDFTLITTQFSPEFGHSSGGQFNTNILSGTNTFHGRVYEYFQNRNLNAAGGVAGGKIPNPRYDNNRYGAQFGGPIYRDKLFFFGNYERNSIGQSSSYYLCTPTASGFSTLNSVATAYGFSANNLQQYEKYTPVSNITGPGGAGIDASADNICGNQKTGAQYYTVTNGKNTASTPIALGNYLVNAPVFSNFYATTAGVDYTISTKDSLRARYVFNNLAAQDTAAALPAFFLPAPTKNYLATISEYHTFTPNLTNEFRIGFNRYYNNTPVGNFQYPGLDSFPNLFFYDQASLDIGPDGDAPQYTIQNLYQVTDNISYAHGKNTVVVGFDGRKYISPQFFIQRARGDYEYALTDQFLHDLAPDGNGFAERSSGQSVYYGDQTALYGYANDIYRASPKLTLNMGLRYEFTSVPYGERAQSLNAIANAPGLISFNKPQPTYTSLAPRIGIEFAPDTKTSIRAGFGIAYDVLFDNLGELSTPPELSQTQDVGTGSAPAFLAPNFLKNGGLPTGGTFVFATTAAARAATGSYVPNQVLPYSENYTLTVQRTLGNGLTAEIGYIGNRGIHLPTQDQINIQPKVNTTNVLPTTVGTSTLQAGGSGATTLAATQALSNILPAYLAAGFTGKITSYQPFSGSNYNGLVANLQGRMKHGLQLNLSYTWSKTMDNATAEVFTTVLTPRRPQNSQNVNADYSRSALDRKHRITLEADYNFQAFKASNWIMRNVVANWTFSPIYTYESPEYATALSGANSNLNGDSGAAIDRPLINPSGVKGTGTGTVATINPALASKCDPTAASGPTAISDAQASNSALPGCPADITGYAAGSIINGVFTPSNAYYVQARLGTLPTAGRNTLPLPVENNLDFAAYKRFTFREHYSVELGAQAFNVLNHAQYIPGSVDNVAAIGYTSSYNYQTVTSSFFNRPNKEFSNNPRTMQLSGKIIF